MDNANQDAAGRSTWAETASRPSSTRSVRKDKGAPGDEPQDKNILRIFL